MPSSVHWKHCGHLRTVGFEFPEPLAIGNVEVWHYMVTSALSPELHHVPMAPPIDEIVASIRTGLAAFPRHGETPAHWEPMHGDFTPWNLRERRNGTCFLIDWEDASWAPPGADEVYYGAVDSILRNQMSLKELTFRHEAVAFWREQLLARVIDAEVDTDIGLSRELLDLFIRLAESNTRSDG